MLPDDIARWARVWAAEHDTSVSGMLADFLKEKMNEAVEYRHTDPQGFMASELRKIEHSGL